MSIAYDGHWLQNALSCTVRSPPLFLFFRGADIRDHWLVSSRKKIGSIRAQAVQAQSPPAPFAGQGRKKDLAVARKVAIDEDGVAGRVTARIAELGDQPPLQWLCGATIATGVLSRDRKLARAGLRMLAAHSFATLAKAFVKDGVDRTRPGEALDGRHYRMKPGHSRDHGLQSMPSGHSAGTTAVAAAALVDYPQAAGATLAGAGTVIATQLPSRNHYLSDVAVGGALGLVAFGLSRLLLPPFDEQQP